MIAGTEDISLAAHHGQLEVWAENCLENFKSRAALVGADIARIEGRVLDAEHFYKAAIRSAHANGFVHNKTVASELAADPTHLFARRPALLCALGSRWQGAATRSAVSDFQGGRAAAYSDQHHHGTHRTA